MTPNTGKKCYTIGYGNSPVDHIVTLLRENHIETLIDVRSVPYSRFNPDFRRESLEKFPGRFGIGYRYLGDKIGGKPTDPGLLRTDGTADYRRVRESEKFRDGINEVISLIEAGGNIALMCAEKEPERCHRFALITPALQALNVRVIHILASGELLANDDLENSMVDRLFDRSQRRLTGEPEDLVAEMYEKVASDF